MRLASLRAHGCDLIPSVEIAENALERMKGLLGRASMGRSEALYLAPCGCIHTFFMTFPIDACFVTAEMRVVRLFRNIQPYRMVFGGRSAKGVIESPAGLLSNLGIRAGDRLELTGPDA